MIPRHHLLQASDVEPRPILPEMKPTAKDDREKHQRVLELHQLRLRPLPTRLLNDRSFHISILYLRLFSSNCCIHILILRGVKDRQNLLHDVLVDLRSKIEKGLVSRQNWPVDLLIQQI